MPSTCEEAAFGLPVTMVVGGIQLISLLVILVWQWRNLRRAEKETSLDPGDFRFILTPVYRGILYGFAITLLLFALGSLLFRTRPTAGQAKLDAVIYWSISTWFYHMVVEGIAILLLMKGAGMSALKRGAIIAAVVALALGAIQALVYLMADWYPNTDYNLYVQLAMESLLWAFYLILTIAPQSWCPRRPACVFYAGAWAVYKPMYMALLALMYFGYDGAYCGYMIYTWIIWGAAKPIIIYWSLYLDSLYWQGLYQGMFKGRARTDSFDSVSDTSDVRRPLLGTSIDHGAASALAEGLDNAQEHCPVIHQSQLSLDDGASQMGFQQASNVLGAGGTARVFKGRYANKTVAVKMLYCPTLIRETIDNFFRENALLCRIRHPNIVGVEGVCVSPPAVASVMELCRGNLFELLRLPSMHFMDWGTRLGIALDCIRGVACMHRMGYTHRDIKSANYLVGSERVSQWDARDVARWLVTEGLAEFVPDFASARVVGSSAKRSSPGLLQLTRKDVTRIVADHRQRQLELWGRLIRALTELQRITRMHMEQNAVIKLTDLELSHRQNGKATARSEPESMGCPQTVNWTAPEVISSNGQTYTKASDVYSCGMLLWEILTGRVPYEDEGGDVAALIVEHQQRPHLPKDTDPDYAQLLQAMWHPDPDQRPTAREVIGILEGMRTCYLNNRMDDDEDEDDNASMHSTIEHDESLYASQRFAPESDEPRPWLAVSAQSSVAASPQQEGIRLKSLDDSLISIDRSGPSHGNHPLLLRQQPIDEMGDDGDLNV